MSAGDLDWAALDDRAGGRFACVVAASGRSAGRLAVPGTPRRSGQPVKVGSGLGAGQSVRVTGVLADWPAIALAETV